MDEMVSVLSKLGPIGSALAMLGTFVGIVASAIIKAKSDAKKRERRMQSVPPTPAQPPAFAAHTQSFGAVAHLLAELEQERLRRHRATWEKEEVEGALRRMRTENEQLARALNQERGEHEMTRERERYHRALSRELEERARALDSGFTEITAAALEPPSRVVEQDAQITRPARPLKPWRKP